MRSNQQNKRSRSRGNRNKNQNPLTRSYESNGPDVRIRGTAQHIAEKYAQLARDANSSGDSVAAENYLQHAEHYSRIILTAQAQQQARFEQNEDRDDSDSDSDGDDADGDDNVIDAGSDDADEAKPEPVVAEEKPAKRERRPRRRPRQDEGNKADAVDPASAPQPSLNDLPAFVTGGADVKAAE